MRLVKKTVNQDDMRAYHLFYGDDMGSPGSDITFFDWPDVPSRSAWQPTPSYAPGLRVSGEPAWHGGRIALPS